MFIIDIVLNFFFVDEDVNGDMIIDQKRIAVAYLKSWFIIDVFASIPVTIITLLAENNDKSVDRGLVSIRFLKLTKFARLYRLLTLFKVLKLVKKRRCLEIMVNNLSVSPDVR